IAEVVSISLGGFMKPLLWLTLTVYAAARFTRWTGSWKVVAVGGALCVFTVPLVQTYRSSIAAGEIDTRSVESAGIGQIAALVSTWESSPDKAWGILVDKVFSRQSQLIYSPALIVKMTPE